LGNVARLDLAQGHKGRLGCQGQAVSPAIPRVAVGCKDQAKESRERRADKTIQAGELRQAPNNKSAKIEVMPWKLAREVTKKATWQQTLFLSFLS